jgi:inhibitor of cysteine peptidase
MKLAGITSLVVSAVLFAGCATPTTKTLTVFDNNKQINLTVGEMFVVALPTNPTMGYWWSYEQEGNAFLEQVGEPGYQTGSAPVGTAGGNGTEYYTFRASNAGQQTLKLDYVRPFVKDAAPVQTVSYDLVVGGNEK